MLGPCLGLPWCAHTAASFAIYRAIATPNIPIAPSKLATTPVGAAPALLELEGAAELDAFVVVAAAEAVTVVEDVATELFEPVAAGVVADGFESICVAGADWVIKPASTSREAILGMRVNALPAIPMIQFCASDGREVNQSGKPLARISL